MPAYGSAMVQEASQEGEPPVVVFTLPADGQSDDVDRDNHVFVMFSEEMCEKSISGKTLLLYEGDERVSATVSYETIGKSRLKHAVLDPKYRLKPNTEYTAVVEGAADDDESP